MKRLRWVHVVLGLLMGSAFTCGLPHAQAAESYILIDNQTGHILASKDANEKRQIASITKIATALVVLDMAELKKVSLSDMAVVPMGALSVGGVNPAGLQEGDSMSLRDLIYCSLLASDNIAATTLAHYAGARLPNPESLSPIGNFVANMNALARGLKMRRTLFLNPAGLDGSGEDPQPHSTAADVARLVRYAYGDADFPFYVAQPHRTIQVVRQGQSLPVSITNTNSLLGQEGIDGVKTGRTSRSGDCVVLSSEQKPEVVRDGATTYVTPRRIHVVVLGSPDRFVEGLELTRRGWGLYNQWAAAGRKTGGSKSL